MSRALTLEELIAELEAIKNQAEDPDGFFTSEELQEAWGVSKYLVSKRLRMLNRAGRLETQRVTRPNIVGAMWPRPGYRVLAG